MSAALGMTPPAFRLITGSGQVFTSTGTSQASTPFGIQTHAIRVYATGNVNIRIDNNPVATATDGLLLGGKPEYFTVNPGQQLAVIGGGAKVHLTELTE